MKKLIICSILISLASLCAADNEQTYPGQVTGTAGQVQDYSTPQPQQVAPLNPNQVPGSQDPNGYIKVDPSMRRHGLEQCQVIAPDGTGRIKEYMADSGLNAKGDPNAWIWVPLGMCAQINAGNYSNVPPEILDKINH